MYGVREAFSQAALTDIKNSRYTDEDVFVNFQHIAYWDATYHYVVDFVVFINIIKFVRLLRYSRRMCIMVTVLIMRRAIAIVKRQIKLEQSRDLEMAEFIRNNILSWLPLVDKLSPPTPEGPKYVDQGTSCDLIDLDLDLLAAAELDYVIVKLDQLFPEASRVETSGECGDSKQGVDDVKDEKKVVMVDSCN
ncbi:hypothetical protein Bbelb_247020 [Branchiostoma belcheri]|nr:hypothetical protein Bbelb_247020 [Branchiostoma belcheri]